MRKANKQGFNRHAAFAAIHICWKQMSPDGDRDERLAWIANYLGLDSVDSLTELTDNQLGAVAGEMKKRVGRVGRVDRVSGVGGVSELGGSGKVVRGDFGVGRGDSETPQLGKLRNSVHSVNSAVFLSTDEQVFTIEKLIEYIGWPREDMDAFLKKRFKTANLKMMRFNLATAATAALLKIAAHRDLKRIHGDEMPIGRELVNGYVPLLKKKLDVSS